MTTSEIPESTDLRSLGDAFAERMERDRQRRKAARPAAERLVAPVPMLPPFVPGGSITSRPVEGSR